MVEAAAEMENPTSRTALCHGVRAADAFDQIQTAESLRQRLGHGIWPCCIDGNVSAPP